MIKFSTPKLEVLTSPERKLQCIKSMAACLAQIMTIRDPETKRSISWSEFAKNGMNEMEIRKAREAYWKRDGLNFSRCVPFGALLFAEFAVKATREQERRLELIFELDRFASATCSFCQSMVEESDEMYVGDFFFEDDQDTSKSADSEAETGAETNRFKAEQYRTNVDLFFYAYSIQRSPFFLKYNYTTSNGFKIPIGGICKSLCDEFEILAHEWLCKCDKNFCQANGISYDQNDAIDEYIRNLSKAIARRHALLRHPRDVVEPQQVDSVLEMEALECLAVYQFWTNNFTAYQQRGLDLEALTSLLVLAKEGGHSQAARNVILKHTSHIKHVLDNPPQELGLHMEKRVKKFNLSALRKILSTGIENPFLCRCACVHEWYEKYGEWASTEIQNAIDCINRPDVRAGTRYLEVVGTHFKRGSIEMPTNPCAYEETEWYAYVPDFRKRPPLSEIGIRFVCMTTFMRKRIEADTLQFGTCTKQILHNIATDHLRKASYARVMLEADRLRSNQGVSLRMFERDFQNGASDVNQMLDLPMCSLSGVSYVEMAALFGDAKIFMDIRRDLSLETRKLIQKNVVPEDYIRFTDDALTIVLDCIKGRRESHGIKSFVRTNAFSDLLRCIPKVRECLQIAEFSTSNLPCVLAPMRKPMEFLTLSIQDLAKSHRHLRGMLDAQCKTRNEMVWIGSKGHEKIQFVFDVKNLRALLQT